MLRSGSLLKLIFNTGRLCSAGSTSLRSPTFFARTQPSDSLQSLSQRYAPRLRAAYHSASAVCLTARWVHLLTSQASESLIGAPHHRCFTVEIQGLPGYWAVLFVRAMVCDLAEPGADLTLSR